MKFQWSLLFALIFAVIVAIFAVVNVDEVPVNYVFGTATLPLILVILGSALLGALVSGSVAIFRSFVLQRRVRQLEKDNTAKESLIAAQQNEISALNKNEPGRYQDAHLATQDKLNGETVVDTPLNRKDIKNDTNADVRSTS
ncbi:lipopolysaccharide assembly protein LapA domain-containing protein [Paenisporosarcina quisquiliarum]|uniref:Lipopolysaccharide assembly protein LapA domain-containing protein n=1 Tax=Paenisporosarcina quisquiliarum TaxID=365346 RepID=A0A9X3LGU7_9BACL|nr:lipopolysaccharide assembly protein LapA domain-containing protein [Paenisporosarcina quisquiliarum]MCZ8536139.1 lipopolysaccharide assembly protein LapA domain-containing protein [Paenisporosarcina quisquiliarum]